MNNDELRELVHLLLMCGIMDKTATESGNVTDEEWLRMKNLINKYQTEGGINCEPDKSGDLISRSYLKNLPFERVIHTDFGDTAIPIEEIDNAPTVEAYTGTDLIEENKKGFNTAKRLYERPQGEWIDYNAYYKTCSICKRTVGIDFLIQKYEDKPEEYSFCPNCGADMRKGEMNERLQRIQSRFNLPWLSVRSRKDLRNERTNRSLLSWFSLLRNAYRLL